MEKLPGEAPHADPPHVETQPADVKVEDDVDTPQALPHDSPQLSPVGADGDNAPTKNTAPIQKRRRVTRACDECRRKKIKCDGKQPCTHCTVYSYECTYDQPSNRRRNAAPHYIEALESQLKRAQNILKLLLPNADLNDLNLEIKIQQGLLTPSPQVSNASLANDTQATDQPQDPSMDPQLESMVKSTGQLELDEQGNLEYHGHSSGLTFARRIREQLGDVMGPDGQGTPFVKSRPISQVFDSPRSNTDSPWDSSTGTDLPSREVALELCDNAINDAASLMRFVHWPTFKKQLDAAYDKAPDTWGNDENTFLPLLYATMALGTLFSKDEGGDLDRKGYESAIERGFKYFRASRSLMDIADCRDLRQLQAIIFMIMFLQSSAKLSTCYAYIGVALRSALRMGLHRSFPDNFNPIVAESRKRIFWVIRKMDTYVGALLGLPHSINDEDIDQEYPAEVDDEFITEEGILQMPEGRVSVMSAANAHTRLVTILSKIVRFVYPLKGSHVTVHGKTVKSYSVSYAKILEIERDLQEWQDKLQPGLKPGGDAPHIIIRVQQLLRLSYAHAQMMLYRPFLHYVSQTGHSRTVDKRSYACAAACVSVSRNIIHIAVEMKKRHLLIGAYWFTMYTTFFAILSLVFYALENPENNASQDVLRVAKEGKDTLEALAKRSMAADRCTATLAALFEQLPERLSRTRQNSISKKRRQNTSPRHAGVQVDTKLSESNLSSQQYAEPRRSNTFPQPSSPTTFSATPSQTLDSSTFQFSPSHSFFDLPPGLSPRTTAATPTLSSGLSQQPESYPMSPTNFTDPNFPLADLSSVMFPSADPFAYPDQNMPPAQSYDQIAKNINQNMFGYTANARFQHGTNGIASPHAYLVNNGIAEQSPTQESDVQLLGPTPFYLMQGNPAQQQQSTESQPNGQMNDQAFASQDNANHPFNNQNQDFSKNFSNGGLANLQVPNMNLDQLLGGEEWVGLDRTTSGMGTYVGPPTTANGDNSAFRAKQMPQQTGLGVRDGDNMPYEELIPESLNWSIDGYTIPS